MNRRDSALELKRAHTPQAQRLLDKPQALRDLFAVPTRTILFLQCYQLAAIIDARVTPRVMQQHQRQ